MNEKQYNDFEKEFAEKRAVKLGISASRMFRHDPKYMAFKLARYKFVAKMLEGKHSVLEVGAGEGFASHIVAQHVDQLTCTDFDKKFVENGKKICEADNMIFKVYNPLEDNGVFKEKFDAIYLMDVLEHIEEKVEDRFLSNLIDKLINSGGVMIVGIPSIEGQAYAAEHNKIGHVNCKSGNEFKRLMQKYFHNVFLFSANDEVIHTGFMRMAHSLIALCVGKK